MGRRGWRSLGLHWEMVPRADSKRCRMKRQRDERDVVTMAPFPGRGE